MGIRNPSPAMISWTLLLAFWGAIIGLSIGALVGGPWFTWAPVAGVILGGAFGSSRSGSGGR